MAPSAVVDDGGDLVLDGDVAAEAVGDLGEDRLRHAADPLPQVELVGCLVDQHAAALPAPGGPPGGLVVVALRPPPGGDDPAGVADRADLAVVDDLLDPLVQRVVALVEHDREGQLRVGRRVRVELGDLPGVDPGRLLDQGVDAAPAARRCPSPGAGSAAPW